MKIEYQDLYSSTEEVDFMGRWARLGYINGILVCWIKKVIPENKSSKFICHNMFPTNSNHNPKSNNVFNTLEEAKKQVKKDLKYFIQKITKK